MPLYGYRCLKCRELVEKIQKFSDPPPKKCAKCGGRLERLLSSPAIQFKGTGWYITDYARKSPAGSSKDEGKASAKSDGSKNDQKKSEPAVEKSSAPAPTAKK